MSDKFKVAGYIEGFDMLEEDVYDAPEPSAGEKAFIFAVCWLPLLLPVLIVVGANFAQGH